MLKNASAHQRPAQGEIEEGRHVGAQEEEVYPEVAGVALVLLAWNLDHFVVPIGPLVEDYGEAGDGDDQEANLLHLMYSLPRRHHDRNQDDAVEIPEAVDVRLHRVLGAPNEGVGPAGVAECCYERDEVHVLHERAAAEGALQVKQAQIRLRGQCDRLIELLYGLIQRIPKPVLILLFKLFQCLLPAHGLLRP